MSDLILYNANVLTLEGRRPRAELVAVKGDKISFVGENKELPLFKSKGGKLIDLEGKTLLPGFNDAHCHIFSYLRKLLSLDLSGVKSIAEIKEAILRQAQKTPKGRWLTGTGYNEFNLAEKRHPTRFDLDDVAPEHPVILVHQSLHACVLNSLALSLAQISGETEEPPGALFERSPSGELTGVLFEMLAYIRSKVLPPLSEEELEQASRLANEHYLSSGITSLQDLSPNNDFERWQTFSQLKERGKLKSRICMFFGVKARGEFEERGLTTGFGSTSLRLGGLKVMLSQATGKLEPSKEELEELILSSHQGGYQVAIHATSEEMVTEAISALENLKAKAPDFPRRHQIVHCSESPPHLFERLKKLKPLIVTQPPFIYFNGDRYLKSIPAEHHRFLYRIGSFLKEGLTVAGSSDSPVVPHNPLIGIYAACTRKTEGGKELAPEEKVTPWEALKLYTLNGAYASFEEEIKGSIKAGKLADMVVLSDDPTKPPPERIKEIKVLATIIGGELVWEV